MTLPTAPAHLSRRGLLTAGTAALAAVPLIAVAGSGTAWASPPAAPAPFGPVTLYAPPADRPAPGTLYARAVRLTTRSSRARSRSTPLLATFEQYVSTDPVFPILRSDDDGRTWAQISSVRDTVNGWGLRYQPFLYELPAAFAGFPKGTVLCAGNSIPDDLSQTKIDVYASTDGARTWHFVSSVARGGKAVPNNTETAVWEPFLLLRHGRLICFYSDQRDHPRYGQKLVHQTTTDLRSWGPVVEDAVGTDPDQRPGMTTVAALPDGRWIMTYEGGGGVGDNFFAVHYRIAADPERFAAAPVHVLHDASGHVPSGSPTISWSPSGGRSGTLVVSANSDQDLFLNRSLGAEDAWTRVPSRVAAGYARYTVPLGRDRVLTVSGGVLRDTGLNTVQDAADSLT